MKKLSLVIAILSFQTYGFSQTNIFPSSGDVGIGTLSPSERLHIKRTGGPASFLLERDGGAWFKAVAGSSFGGFYYKSDKALIFSSDGGASNIPNYSNSLVFYGPSHPTYPGQVTIGIATPGDNSKLSIDGRVRSEELKIVNNVEAPDYVFKSDYKLASLTEVENFIKEKGHLPEIPSAFEFKQDGILVGKMSFDLLKKIEELTLHIIDLNKRIQVLESSLEK